MAKLCLGAYILTNLHVRRNLGFYFGQKFLFKQEIKSQGEGEYKYNFVITLRKAVYN